MTIGDREIFGPVLCIKRVKDFEEGLAIMNASEFANGSVIYTQSGYYAREFAKRTHGGMVGINVGIPVPLGHLRLHRPQELVLRRPARAWAPTASASSPSTRASPPTGSPRPRPAKAKSSTPGTA